jgi:hypothetical protein
MIVVVWPPRSPGATPCDFFLWGYVKDQVYVPPLLASIPELKVRIRTAIETITADMLQTVWTELDYRVDVCTHKRSAVCDQPHPTHGPTHSASQNCLPKTHRNSSHSTENSSKLSYNTNPSTATQKTFAQKMDARCELLRYSHWTTHSLPPVETSH